MNRKIVNLMIFVLGAAVGSVATGQYFKRKYEQLTQSEIDSVREAFSRKDLDTNKQSESESGQNEPSMKDYIDVLHKKKYVNYSDTGTKCSDEGEKKLMSNETAMRSAPYIISPNEFGELDDYESISLTYYADQILADEDDVLVEDVENTVGFESLVSFGTYEEDSVFVRNDRLRCDYEVLRDQNKYEDVIKRNPHEA